MKKVIVTGGAGFLGSHLCKRLLDEGKNVVCIDNLYTGSMQNIMPLLENDRFVFYEHDIIKPYDIEADEIYNLACPASPVHYQKDPIYTAKISIFGILNALELAKKTGAKLLQASTSEIYGDALVHPQNENYFGNVNPTGVRSCYDEGKRVAESLICDYRRTYNLDLKIVRIFNTYGPNMDKNDGRVVSNFIVQALLGQDITIYGDGTQTRSFCYVDDLIDGFLKMMNSALSGPVNLGNPKEHTIREFADIIIKLTGSNSKIINMPLPQDDPKQRRPDIALAKKELNFEPKVELDEGLKKTIEYFKKRGIL